MQYIYIPAKYLYKYNQSLKKTKSIIQSATPAYIFINISFIKSISIAPIWVCHMLPSWLQIDAGIGTRRGSRKLTLKIVVWYFVAFMYLRSTQPPSSPGESRTLATQGVQWNNSGNLSLVAAWSGFRWIAIEIKWLWYLVAMVTVVLVETVVSWWLLMALRMVNKGKKYQVT